MRKVFKYFVFTIILSFSLCFYVNAECSYSERKELLNAAKNVEIQTEIKTIKSPAIVSDGVTETTIEEDKDVIYFHITGVTEDIYVKYYNLFYTEEIYPEEEIIDDDDAEYYEEDEKEYEIEKYISYKKLTDGIYTFSDEDTVNFYNYYFEIYSNNKNCAGKLMTKKTIKKPAVNKYSGLEVCQRDGLENYKYCYKYITEEIKMDDVAFEKKVNSYLNARVEPEQLEETKKIDVKTIIIISTGIIVVIAIGVILIVVRKKKNEL